MKHAAVKLERRRSKAGAITQYDPEKGLKSVAVMEAAEKHFTRAKDVQQLFQAIAEKIAAQADYVVWRDSVVVHGRGPGRGKKEIARVQSLLPAADPGHDIAHRWRKAFCAKDADGATVVDSAKVAEAVNNTVRKATRLIEHKNKPKPAKQKRNTVIDPEKLKKATEDAQRRSQQIVEQEQGVVRGTGGTGNNEWRTPKQFIKLVREVFGGTIDVDPASSELAQRTVGAVQYFTKQNDGLTKEWRGKIFLNPPYAQPYITDFVEKLIAEVRADRATAAILLTHAYTSSAWFQDAARLANAICFTSERVRFVDPGGEEANPTQGQAFSYFGPDVAAFARGFANVGFVVQPMRGCSLGGEEP
jgi:phage N-6-adenine-methyltransferase